MTYRYGNGLSGQYANTNPSRVWRAPSKRWIVDALISTSALLSNSDSLIAALLVGAHTPIQPNPCSRIIARTRRAVTNVLPVPGKPSR